MSKEHKAVTRTVNLKQNLKNEGSCSPLKMIILSILTTFRVTHASSAVGCIKRIKNAIGVARAIMKYTKHSLMVGDDGM